MTPQIALDLSLDSITVLSRAPEGGWWREGTVRLAAPDMPERMAQLRDMARRRAGPDFTSILVLPDSQLLFTSLECDDRRPDETIRALLRGRTPYDVADLTWDYVRRGDRLQVAVVALDTLMEAESFAAEYGFRPVAVVANPSDATFPGIPEFGKTGLAGDLLNGATLDLRVQDGFRAVAAPPLPEPLAPSEDAAAEMPAPDPSPAAEPHPAPAASRPEPAEAASEEPPAPEPESEPVPAMPAFRHAAAPAVSSKPEPAAPDPKPAEDASTSGFTTARRGAPPIPAARAESGERLSRIAPRLTAAAPAPALSRADTAPPLPTPADVEATGRRAARYADASPARDAKPSEPPLTAPPPPAATPKEGKGPSPDVMAALRAAAKQSDSPPPPRPKVPPLSPPGSLAARIKQRAAEEREARETAGDEGDRPEAEALALPGIGREQARERRGGARLGLMLTLALLAILMLVGVGAALVGGDDPLPLAAEPAAADSLLPRSQAAAFAPTPAPAGAAALLPAPGSVTEGAVRPDAITAPAPIATPVLARSIPDETLSEDQLKADIAPDLALAPAFEAPPVAETAPAVFIEQWQADGDFVAPGLSGPPADAARPDVTVAALDPGLAGLATPRRPDAEGPALAPARQLDPPPPELIESRDAALGLIPATAEGVVAPGGYAILLGRPVTLPRPRPGGAAEAALAALTAPAPEPEIVEAAILPDAAVAAPDGVETAPAPIPPAEAALLETPPEPSEAELVLRRVRPVERPEAADSAANAEAARLAEEAAAEEAELAARAAADAEMRRVLPRQRPATVAETVTAAEAAVRAAQEAAEAAAISAAQQAAAASLANAGAAVAAEAAQVSALALPQSERPRTRPRSVERDAARIVTQRREQTAAAPAPQQADRGRQEIRSAGGNVARAATERNVLRLNQINLIGVYGRPDARRALVRLANGRYVKVEVGDRLDRGRVTAIGDDRLQYQRGSRNVVLRLPRV